MKGRAITADGTNFNQAAEDKPRGSRGRPSKLSKKLAREICERLEAGVSGAKYSF